MRTTDRGEAAQQRAAGVAARADRPRERRAAGGGVPGARGALRSVDVVRGPAARTLRAAGAAGEDDVLTFTGCASVYETGYEMWDYYGPYTEIVSAGAATTTLAAGPDTVFLINHAGLPLARTSSGTLQLSQDDVGLQTIATFDPANTLAADLASAMRRGDMTEMSFAFMITSGQWSPDYTEFRINAFDLDRGDVSAVTYGANPATTSQVRAPAGDVVELLAQADEGLLRRAGQAIDARRSALGLLTRSELADAWALAQSRRAR